MENRGFFPALLVGLALLFALSSCSKDNGKANGGGATSQSYRADIPLTDVSSDAGCLSLPKLFQALRDVPPGRPAVSVPVAIAFDSTYAIRDDFERVIADGQLAVDHQGMGDLLSLPDASQDACSAVTTTASDGSDKSFKVKNSAKDSLMAEADDGERLEFTWLTSTSISYRHRYAVLDQPCSTSDKSIFVTVTKVIDWSSAGVPATVPATGSPFSVDPQFITLASAAVGDSPDSLYVNSADGTKMIDLDRLTAMTAKPVRPEILSCGGVAEPTPVPAPTPTPTPDPNDPNHHS